MTTQESTKLSLRERLPLHWFTKSWWSYLLEGGWPGFRTLICRARGHPYGVVWFSSGFEPDMHCKNCGDDLG